MNQKEFERSVAWTRIVAGCVVRRDDGKFLMVQEKQPKVYGLWNIPAGHVDKEETIEAAAIREAQEETGYKLKLLYKVKVYHRSVNEPVFHAFKAEIVGGGACGCKRMKY